MSDISFLSEDEYLEKDRFLKSRLEEPSFSKINKEDMKPKKKQTTSSFKVEDDEETKTDKKMKIIKVSFLILCLLLLFEVCMVKLVKPSLSTPRVTISGNSNYSVDEIVDCLLTLGSTNWFDFDVKEAEKTLKLEAGIEDAVVKKEFPDKVFVNIIERVPVALTFFVQDGNTIPVQIDRNGVLFYDEDKDFANVANLPIVSGIPIDYLANGMRIPKIYKPLIEQIAKISENHKEYFEGISEICVIPTDNENYELALISAQTKVKVIADRTLNEDALKDMMVVLDVIKLIDADVREVDLRYQSVSYKIK